MDLLEPGQIFVGRYRVERFLARGGFGAVFVAEQLNTEMKVAIKVLWPHVLGSRDAVEKFQLEARVAARVNSEHIVKVLDAGVDAETGLPFLTMELLKGRSLAELVEKEGPLPAQVVTEYVRQVALGLDKAHGYVDRDGNARPIVHRDLKPDNLFLTARESGEGIVKILDFGIAKVLSSSTGVSQEVKGTPLYMAHEQALGGAVSPRSDIWALGLIAYYLLTGTSYWRAGSNPEATVGSLFAEILSLPIEPPTQRATQAAPQVTLPSGFDAWFLRCVSRDPEQRFLAAGQAAAALANALDTSAKPSAANVARTAILHVEPPVVSEIAPSASPAVGTAVTASALAVSQVAVPLHSPRNTWLVVAAGALLTAGGVAAVAWVKSAGSEASPSASGAPLASAVPAAVPAPAAHVVVSASAAASSPAMPAPSASVTPTARLNRAVGSSSATAKSTVLANPEPAKPPPDAAGRRDPPSLYGDR